MVPASEFSMGTTARQAAPDTTASKSASKVGRGRMSTSPPSSTFAASWLKAPSSPWIATLRTGSVIALLQRKDHRGTEGTENAQRKDRTEAVGVVLWAGRRCAEVLGKTRA